MKHLLLAPRIAGPKLLHSSIRSADRTIGEATFFGFESRFPRD